jgi:hypothetical protein
MFRMRSGGPCFLSVVLLLCASPIDGVAITFPVTRVDLERAVALARWPRPDADRARFHERYLFTVNSPPVASWIVEQVEVITEFRRVELLAEEHEKLHDLWGKGGAFRDVEESMRPWVGRVAVVARLALRTTLPYSGDVPAVEIAIGGARVMTSKDVRRTDLYANCGGVVSGCPVIGGIVEAIFDAAAIGNTTRPVIVRWKGDELADVLFDFAGLE